MQGGLETYQGNAVNLVIGGSGFIGSHLVRELARQQEKVRVFDRLNRQGTENVLEAVKVFFMIIAPV